MASTAATLADLRDIHLPHAVSFWPLGPAYYGLLGLLVIALLLWFKHLQKIKRTASTREALQLLDALEADYSARADTKSTAADITAILKRVALVYHPRTEVASLHGDAWRCFLEDTSDAIDFKTIQISLLNTPFNPHANEDLTPLFTAARRWIKQRRRNV